MKFLFRLKKLDVLLMFMELVQRLTFSVQRRRRNVLVSPRGRAAGPIVFR